MHCPVKLHFFYGFFLVKSDFTNFLHCESVKSYFQVQQLLDMMELSDGVMLLGESYGGKTKALKTLAASLQAAQGPNGKAPSCVILNPKAMKIDQLYGWFDADEWKDGILATSFRHFDSLPKEVSFKPLFFVKWYFSSLGVTDETFQLARSIFCLQVEIIILLSEPKVSSIIR